MTIGFISESEQNGSVRDYFAKGQKLDPQPEKINLNQGIKKFW